MNLRSQREEDRYLPCIGGLVPLGEFRNQTPPPIVCLNLRDPSAKVIAYRSVQLEERERRTIAL